MTLNLIDTVDTQCCPYCIQPFTQVSKDDSLEGSDLFVGDCHKCHESFQIEKTTNGFWSVGDNLSVLCSCVDCTQPPKPILRLIDEGFEHGGQALKTVYNTNYDAFKSILDVYGRKGMKIADVTYGKGTFWRTVDEKEYALSGTDLLIDDVDFRKTPYDDESFEMVVFDPPYRVTPKKSTTLAYLNDRYNLIESQQQTGLPPIDLSRPSNILDLYDEGMSEAHRVLEQGGFLVVKCQDTVEANHQNLMHINIIQSAERMGFFCRDMLIVVTKSIPRNHYPRQKHFRKAHSYFLIFRKGGSWPWGLHTFGNGTKRKNNEVNDGEEIIKISELQVKLSKDKANLTGLGE